ncbi:hypothetical protein ACHAWF_015521 [Thalassiosira exigua]
MSEAAAAASCASCGDRGDGLKACAACMLVKYCGVACQRAHRPRHKRECRKRAAELRDEALFADPPPKEDCPICFLPMPANQRKYLACCGKRLCDGCSAALHLRGDRRCPLCRSTPSEDEIVKDAKARADAGCAESICELGFFHKEGRGGLKQDPTRASDLWLRAGGLGCARANLALAGAYYDGNGVEKSADKAKYYWKLAAMGGNEQARYNLGVCEGKAHNYDRAVKHFLIASGSGCGDSLGMIQLFYSQKVLTKDVFEKALRAHQKAIDEMKSDQRHEAAIRLAGHF